jgi:hypothetical protein
MPNVVDELALRYRIALRDPADCRRPPSTCTSPPKEVIASCVYNVQGTTSTYNVESGITFSAPVETTKD